MKQIITLLIPVFFVVIRLGAQPLPEMIKVEGGTFKMGDRTNFTEWEKPVHEVTVKSFYMGKTEVTVEQYYAYCKEKNIDKPSQPTDWSGWEESERPVVNVSWLEAQEYLKWLSEKTGKKYRLPTEAEWEYAARGGKYDHNYEYAGSNTINEVAWYTENVEKLTYWDKREGMNKPVGRIAQRIAQKKPNELGLYDMTGNVWEWCSDLFSSSYYERSPKNNPQGPQTGSSDNAHTIRGGGFYTRGDDQPVSRRYGREETRKYKELGFRVVCEL